MGYERLGADLIEAAATRSATSSGRAKRVLAVLCGETAEFVEQVLVAASDAVSRIVMPRVVGAPTLIDQHYRECFARKGSISTFGIVLRGRFISRLTSIEFDGTAVNAIENDAPNPAFVYQVVDGVVCRTDGAAFDADRLSVSYRAGWSSADDSSPDNGKPQQLPGDLEEAVLIVVQRLVDRYLERDDQVVASRQLPGLTSETFALGGRADTGNLPPEALALLAPYRRLSFA